MASPTTLSPLVQVGADLEQKHSLLQQTLLHQTRNLDSVEMLLRAGANPNARDFLGRTTLDCTLPETRGFYALGNISAARAALLKKYGGYSSKHNGGCWYLRKRSTQAKNLFGSTQEEEEALDREVADVVAPLGLGIAVGGSHSAAAPDSHRSGSGSGSRNGDERRRAQRRNREERQHKTAALRQAAAQRHARETQVREEAAANAAQAHADVMARMSMSAGGAGLRGNALY